MSKKFKLAMLAEIIIILVLSSCQGQGHSCSSKCTSESLFSNQIASKMDQLSSSCSKCGKKSCSRDCSANKLELTNFKEIVPSCSLSNEEMADRKSFLQATMAKKIVRVEELETGYDLIFKEPIEYSQELLEFINFERSCCANFSFSLVFEPYNEATHLQIYGSADIKEEIKRGFTELGFLSE